MNWLTNFIRPKIRSIIEQQKDVPENLWTKCPTCDGMLFHRDLLDNKNVCYHCGHHMKVAIKERLELLFDDGKYKTVPVAGVPHDPLKFKDRKRYADRLRDTRQKVGRDDAIIVAKGTINGHPMVIAAFDFAFMGGSMGTAVGEGIVTGAQQAVKDGAAFMVIPASGGARMQEGALSLMQMPRSIVAVEMVKDVGLPYIVLLTDPTTGGVSASFAMVGDIHIAEPGCMIGFAGKRVIQETIREELPEGFQTAEYCLEHGMIDMVVPRKELHETIGRILDLIFNKDTNIDLPHQRRRKNGNKSAAEAKKNGKSGATSAPQAKANNVVEMKKTTASRKKTATKTTAVKKTQKTAGAR